MMKSGVVPVVSFAFFVTKKWFDDLAVDDERVYMNKNRASKIVIFNNLICSVN